MKTLFTKSCIIILFLSNIFILSCATKTEVSKKEDNTIRYEREREVYARHKSKVKSFSYYEYTYVDNKYDSLGIKLFEKFNTKGKLIESIFYQNDGTIMSIDRTDYDNTGEHMVFQERTLFQDGKTPLKKVTLKYDTLENLVELNTWEPMSISKSTFLYKDKNNLIKESVTEKGLPFFEINYHYNDKNKIINEESVYLKQPYLNMIFASSIYSYDEKLRLTDIHEYDFNMLLQSHLEILYNNFDSIISKTKYGKKKEVLESDKYKYDEKTRLIEKEELNKDSKNFKHNKTYYGFKGETIKTEVYGEKGEVLEYSIFKYDNNWNEIENITYNASNVPIKKTTISYEYFE
ncbi:MAG: hypothetical protein NTY74_13875 [Ignavibacteriae bacterium]|nr:hypothetical protein [Ignavibacteriota bacterium]